MINQEVFLITLTNGQKSKEHQDWLILLLSKRKNIWKRPGREVFSEESIKEIMKISKANINDSIFFSCGKIEDIEKILSISRNKIAKDLKLIDENKFSFCWITDYPMYELNTETKKYNLVIILFQCHKAI